MQLIQIRHYVCAVVSTLEQVMLVLSAAGIVTSVTLVYALCKVKEGWGMEKSVGSERGWERGE